MQITKEVTVSKQGGTCINIPKQICDVMDINAGDKLSLSLDTEEKIVKVSKVLQDKIYKIQRPIYGDMDACLIYDENKDSMFQLSYKDFETLFGKDEFKIYVKARFNDKDEFCVIEKLKEQSW